MKITNSLKSILKPASMFGLLSVVSIILAACASAAQVTPSQVVPNPGSLQDAGPSTPTSATSPVETQPGTVAGEAEIKITNNPTLGNILVDGKGMTLYMFKVDEPDKSNCDASCLEKWPPLLTQGSPKISDGVDDSLVGSAKLADGTSIVTYNHMPLYYYYLDTKPGDIIGQEVGDVWYVVSPDGKVVESSSVAMPSPEPPASASEPTINVATDPALGQILVDGKGMTLYIFTRDTADKSNCDASCLEKWPPLLTQGNPILGPGVDDSKLGSSLLPDGTSIVTYDHMPLYYYYNDTKPGDTTGQGVGGVWYVISPDGDIIGK